MIYQICRECKEEKDILSFNKDSSKKLGVTSLCRPCTVLYKKEYYRNNVDKIRKTDKQRYKIEKEKRNAGCHIYYLKNKDKIIANIKKWNSENPDRVKLNKQLNYQKNKEKLRPYGAAAAAKRRASKRLRTPLWANFNTIKKIYVECAKMNYEAGYLKYHVDHEIPIRGKIVSGLHIENNLRIITSYENDSKGNKYEVLL